MSQSDPNIVFESKYKQLSDISIDLILSLKKVSIITKYHINGYDVIFETTNGEVYGFGSNEHGRLGLGHNRPVREATMIPELRNQHIINVEFGASFGVFLIKTGLFICGLDQRGQSGSRSTSRIYSKPKEIIIGECIDTMVDVKCCVNKIYVLTSGKQVFAISPTEVTETQISFLGDPKIIQISCGWSHGLALSESGRVNVWTLFNTGDLVNMFNSGPRDLTPKQLDMPFVKQISCGDHHSLLLTRGGRIYCFGSNDHGQLAINHIYHEKDPKIIESDHKFTEIFAFGNTSMALSESNKIFVWGEIHDQIATQDISSLFETKTSSFQEAINRFSKTSFTYRPLPLKELFTKKVIHQNRVIERMSKAFNDEKDSDLKFKLKRKGTEDQFGYIFANKWFIVMNSEFFERMFANEWSERDSGEIEINGYSYEAYYQFIRYLYTDSIETEDIEVLIEMLSISDEYLDEKLKTKCVQTIKPLRNVENVCSLYSSALRNRSKELEEFCFEYMRKYMNSIAKTEDFQQMDGNYAKEFLSRFSQNPKVRRIE